MIKLKSLTSAVAVIGAIAMMTGCAKEPREELASAKAAVDSAKAAQADIYAAQDFAAAQDSLNFAMAEIKEHKFAAAKTGLASLVMVAKAVKEKAVEAKATLTAELDAVLSGSGSSVSEAKDMLKNAAKNKKMKATVEAMKKEIASVEGMIKDATTLKANGDILSAKEKVAAAMEKLATIKTQLTDAAKKTTTTVKKAVHKAKKKRR
ncbi:MAG: hypothetical protein PHC61_14145 [Chitinivibrionales bacterium]|nr:hypothetical protein [Chitinivibrionales bacterium]